MSSRRIGLSKSSAMGSKNEDPLHQPFRNPSKPSNEPEDSHGRDRFASHEERSKNNNRNVFRSGSGGQTNGNGLDMLSFHNRIHLVRWWEFKNCFCLQFTKLGEMIMIITTTTVPLPGIRTWIRK